MVWECIIVRNNKFYITEGVFIDYAGLAVPAGGISILLFWCMAHTKQADSQQTDLQY